MSDKNKTPEQVWDEIVEKEAVTKSADYSVPWEYGYGFIDGAKFATENAALIPSVQRLIQAAKSIEVLKTHNPFCSYPDTLICDCGLKKIKMNFKSALKELETKV